MNPTNQTNPSVLNNVAQFYMKNVYPNSGLAKLQAMSQDDKNYIQGKLTPQEYASSITRNGLMFAGMTAPVGPKVTPFGAFDDAVDTIRGTRPGTIQDYMNAHKIITEQATRQLTPQELTKHKGSIDTIINLVQDRLRNEENALLQTKTNAPAPLQFATPNAGQQTPTQQALARLAAYNIKTQR